MDFQGLGFSSELSDLDESDADPIVPDVEMADTLTQPLHIDAFCLVEKVCKDFADLIGGEFLAHDLRRNLDRVVEDCKNFTNRKPFTVAVIGKTGAGKSTLLCTPLKCMGLPTSAEVRNTTSAL